MSRTRMIKPAFFKHADLYEAERESGLPLRLAFAGLWTVADREGRFKWKIDLKVDILPYDPVDVLSVLDALERHGFVCSYSVDGKRFGVIPAFKLHQSFHHTERHSVLPAPPPDFECPGSSRVANGKSPVREPAGTVTVAEADTDTDTDTEAVAGHRPTSADIDPVIRDTDRAAPPAGTTPRVALPIDAERFVDQLYSLATEKRQLDVRRQLFDALDPVGRGARLRRGVHVKARDAEHLASCCRAVMADPPRNVDAAIVIVLEKLGDPPPGPTPAERHKAETEVTVAEEDAYQRAAKTAGVRWANEHPDAYLEIQRSVDRQFPSHTSSEFVRITRDSVLIQRCRDASGFPKFAEWRDLQRSGQPP